MSVKLIVKQLLSAISFLHQNHILHRNICLENILISKICNQTGRILEIKLTDFCHSTRCSGDRQLKGALDTNMQYMAPEMINQEYYGFKVDVWSACVVAYTLLSGERPFQTSD